MSEVKKKIHFFQVTASGDKFENILNQVIKLKGPDMYGSKNIYLAALEDKPEWIEGIFRDLRTEDIPAKGKKGQREVTELGLLATEGLAEATHFVYFKQNKILAIEYNFHGVKANAIEEYVNSKIQLLPTVKEIYVSIEIILRRDILEIVANLGQIKMIELGISKNNINAVKHLDDNLFDAYKSASEINDTQYIEIILRPQPRSRDRIMKSEDTKGFIESIKKFFKANLSNDTKFKITGTSKNSHEMQYFDLMESKIENQVKVVKIGKSKMLDSKDMFGQIIASFKDSKNYILKIIS